MKPQEVNRRLYMLRKVYGLNQKEMANYLDISERTYQRIEYNELSPTIETLVKAANLFEIPSSLLLEEILPKDAIEKPKVALTGHDMPLHTENLKELNHFIENISLVPNDQQDKEIPHIQSGLQNVRFNRSFQDLLGLEEAELRGKAINVYTAPVKIVMTFDCLLKHPQEIFFGSSYLSSFHGGSLFMLGIMRLNKNSHLDPVLDGFNKICHIKYPHKYMYSDYIFCELKECFPNLKLIPSLPIA